MKYLILAFSLFVLLSCKQQKKEEITKEKRIKEEQKLIDTTSKVTVQTVQIAEKDTNKGITSSQNRPKRVIDSADEYQSHIEKFPYHAMVSLSGYIPGISIDLRYAHYDNIFNDILYTQGHAFLNIKAAEALKKVQQEIAKDGYELVIWDAYRPYSVTVIMWNLIRDKRYAATPKKGSRHNRGMAVDITLKEIGGEYLEMPTTFDDFSKKASPLYQNLPQHIKENRDYLISKMEKHGFKVLSSEWWHFDYQNWYSMPILDIPFEEMKKVTE